MISSGKISFHVLLVGEKSDEDALKLGPLDQPLEMIIQFIRFTCRIVYIPMTHV